MVEIVALLGVTLAACMLVGEAASRLAGWPPWSWLSGTVGLCVLLAVGSAGASLPGHATTSFVLMAALTVAAAAWIGWSERARLGVLARRAWEPALLAGFVFAATLIPFVANGRVGLLGPSFNNDARFHLWAAEYLFAGQPVPESVLGNGYPLGPHGLVAGLASGFGGGVETGFVVLLMVVPVLMAFVARALLTDLSKVWALPLAGLTALTYLLAAYYAQGAFKETMQALFVLAFAVALRAIVARRRADARAAAVPALLVAGSLLTYSYPGLAWMAAIVGLAAIGLLVVHRRTVRELGVRRLIGRALPAIGVLAAVALVAVGSQAGRVADFFAQLSLSPSGGGVVPEANIGNLVTPLSPYEGLGIWLSDDFRFAPLVHFHTGQWSTLALAVAVFGALWWLRRGEWVVGGAAIVSGLIYVVLDATESAYLAAKALVILSPFPVLLGARALLARAPRLPLELTVLRIGVTVLFTAGVAWSSFLALRNGQVEPDAHGRELVALRPLVHDRDVLFLGVDDYIGYRLFGARVTNPPVQAPVRFELAKSFTEGQSLDFDSATASTLDNFDFVVAPRTAYASVPPRNFAVVRRTRSFDVYARRGATPADPRLLDEKHAPGALLDCDRSASARRLARRAGRALVRPEPVVVRAPPGTSPGFEVGARLALPSAGRWEISIQYASPQALTVSTVTGQRWRLPPNLDRIGPFWRVGDVTTRAARTLDLRLRLKRAAPPILTSSSQFAPFGRIAAVRTDRPARWIALRDACGRYVDRYTLT